MCPRRFLPFVVLVAASVSLLTYAPLVAQSAVLKTRTIVYSPVHMKVVDTLNGSCWEPSIAVERRDAFRCMSGNRIFDPCFAHGTGEVYCPEELIENRGAAIKLTKPLPQANTSVSDQAWAMQLQSGEFCKVGTGTVVPGFPFYCTDGVCGTPYAVEESLAQYTFCGEPSRSGLTVEHPIARFIRTLWR